MRYLFTGLVLVAVLISCSPNNVQEDKTLQSFLDAEKMEGSIGIFNNLSGDFVLSNRKWFRDSASNPGSSFDILQSLIGVETGRVKDEETVLAGISLKDAFQKDSLVFFQSLAGSIGKDTLQKWLDTLGYARRYDTPRIKELDQFWTNQSIRVTADEQLGLVKKLYFDQLPFQRRSHEIVRNLMLVEDSAGQQLAYKISTSRDASGKAVLWMQGWKEKDKHPHFFVIQLRTTADSANLQPAAKRILDKLLAGFLP